MDEGKASGPGKKLEPSRVSGSSMECPALKPTVLDERRLVQEILAGSQEATRTLVEQFQGRLFGLAGRFTRDPFEQEDLVQEIFLKVFRNLGGFKFDSGLFTWIYRVGINAAADYFGARKRRPLVLLEDPETVAGGHLSAGEAPGPARALLAGERRQVVRRVLACLPEKFRIVLALREFEELAYQEIADQLGISIGTVESRLFRARRKFAAEAERLYPGFFPESRRVET